MVQAAGFCRTCNASYVLVPEEENVCLPLCARCELLHRGCAVLCSFFDERSAPWRIAYTQVPYRLARPSWISAMNIMNKGGRLTCVFQSVCVTYLLLLLCCYDIASVKSAWPMAYYVIIGVRHMVGTSKIPGVGSTGLDPCCCVLAGCCDSARVECSLISSVSWLLDRTTVVLRLCPWRVAQRKAYCCVLPGKSWLVRIIITCCVCNL